MTDWEQVAQSNLRAYEWEKARADGLQLQLSQTPKFRLESFSDGRPTRCTLTLHGTVIFVGDSLLASEQALLKEARAVVAHEHKVREEIWEEILKQDTYRTLDPKIPLSVVKRIVLKEE